MKNCVYKIIALTLALITILSTALIGCADPKDEKESTSEETTKIHETETETETETKKETETETEIEPEPVKNDFEIYQSNTICATGSNYTIGSPSNKNKITETYRIMCKVQEYGEFEYKIFFSNNVDSTYGDGSDAYRNMTTKPYKIVSAKVGEMASKVSLNPLEDFKTITFDGKETKDVKARENFWSDAVTLNVPKGHYLVFDWTVEYTFMPATCPGNTYFTAKLNESTGKFVPDSVAALPALIGCNRNNKLRLAFWGDSITMGEGAGMYNSYAAQITDKLGPNVSAWNLGLGYARGNDAVNSPYWIEKAKQNDVVIICFGVNDLNSGAYKLGLRNDTQILNDIATIAKACKDAGCEVIIFSTPPYTYSNSTKVGYWKNLVKKEEELAKKEGYKFFDFAACLGSKDDPSKPGFGGHPNKEGCKVVAEEFIKANIIEVPKDKYAK